MSLIKRTNQQWKVYVFIGLMTLGCALTLSQPLYKDWLGESLTLRVGINAMMLVVANFDELAKGLTGLTALKY